MKDAPSTHALRNTLQYMMSSNIPSEHKVLLIGLLTNALRAEDAVASTATSPEPAEGMWQEQDSAKVRAFLDGKVATSWQHADELVMHLSVLLHREPSYVRSKATDLGFGPGVDYRLAKLRAASEASAQANGP